MPDPSDAQNALQLELDERRKKLGPNHPDTLLSLYQLAQLVERTGDDAGAEPLLRQVIATGEKVFGTKHPNTIKVVYDLAQLLSRRGEHQAAEPLYLRAFEALLGFAQGEAEARPHVIAISNHYYQCLCALGTPTKEAAARVVSLGYRHGFRLEGISSE